MRSSFYTAWDTQNITHVYPVIGVDVTVTDLTLILDLHGG